MADELVSINNLKENILEFELTVEGLSSKEFDTKFVIHSSGMEMAFPCKKDDSGKWSVTLPPLPMLERTAYPFHLQVIAEGFHFRPLKGSVNVVGSPEVYAAGTKNVKLESPTKQEAPKQKIVETVIPKLQPTRNREKSVEQIARELIESNKTTEAKKIKAIVAPPVIAPVINESLLPKIEIEAKKESTTAAKDKATRKVLEELGFQAPKNKTKNRFSLKD